MIASRVFLTLALALTAGCAGTQAAGVGVQRFGLVVGDDDRNVVDNAWLTNHPEYAQAANAVGLFHGDLQCTATYIGGGIAITAGHCVSAGVYERRNRPCDNMPIEWAYRVDNLPYVSRCRRLLAAKDSKPYDYAIMEVHPLPRSEVRAVHNAGTSSGVTAPGVIFQHPGGKPLQFAGSCHIPPYAGGFSHLCDTEKGASGALILEESTRFAVGIHWGDTGGSNAGLYLGHTPLGEIMDERFRPKGRMVAVDGKCLDVREGGTADRTPVQLWQCKKAGAQVWTLTPYRAIVGLAGKCLDIPYATVGTSPWLFACHYGQNQMWQFPEMELRVAASICLDVPGIKPENFTRAQIWKCHGGDGQKWTWTEMHEIKNKQGRCLDATSHHPSNGTTVVVHDCHGGANQIWDIAGGGAIRGISGMCLDIPQGHLANGTQLQLHECNGSTAQVWTLHGAMQTLDGKCLAPADLHPVDGAVPIVQVCTGEAKQQWDYYP